MHLRTHYLDGKIYFNSMAMVMQNLEFLDLALQSLLGMVKNLNLNGHIIDCEDRAYAVIKE